MGSNPIRYSKICTGSLAVKHRGIKTEFSDIGNQLIRSALKYYLSIDKGEPDMLPFVFVIQFLGKLHETSESAYLFFEILIP
jgi:hypothetical protein